MDAEQRKEKAVQAGIAIAEFFFISIPDAHKWAGRGIANAIRFYPGPLGPDDTMATEKLIRKAIIERWQTLTQKQQGE